MYNEYIIFSATVIKTPVSGLSDLSIRWWVSEPFLSVAGHGANRKPGGDRGRTLQWQSPPPRVAGQGWEWTGSPHLRHASPPLEGSVGREPINLGLA